jgi:flavodoxin I
MPKIAIIYGSGLGRTKHMAETIAEGAKTVEDSDIILMDAYDVKIEDIKDADAFVLGGSTYNYKLIKSMDPFLKELEKLDLKGKVGVAFGSYGWSGEGRAYSDKEDEIPGNERYRTRGHSLPCA